MNYTIGQAALGGIIAYINGGGASGTSGLVATVADISSGASWGCSGVSISTSPAIGAGNANTIAIMAGCNTAGIAARLCGDLVQEGYSDWYLPSEYELDALYINRVAISGFAIDSTGYYWSSTEYTEDIAMASARSFHDGNQYMSWKTGNYHVRAVRSFDETCDSRFDRHAYGDECGEDRFRRLRHLGYV